MGNKNIASGQAKLVWHDFPFLGPESFAAAQAARCAADQNKFWAYHDKLYEEQAGENSGKFSTQNLKQFAADLKLDSQQFNGCVDGNQHQADVQADLAAGKQQGINVTPTLFVNGQKIEGVPSYSQLSQVIQQAQK
jgi:protein-disulfide isomerase